MLSSKQATTVPSGAAYADDPVAYTTRRGLSHSTQARHFEVNVQNGGSDIKDVERHFDPWFLELPPPPNIESTMPWFPYLLRRLTFLIIRVSSAPLYDYLFLLSLLSLTILVPYYTTMEGGGTELELVEDKSDFRLYISYVFLFMSLTAAIPVTAGLFARTFLVDFIRRNSDIYTEKRIRFFGVFFFVTLKTFNFSVDVGEVVPGFLGRRIPKLSGGKWGRRREKVAAEGENGGEEGGGGEEEKAGREDGGGGGEESAVSPSDGPPSDVPPSDVAPSDVPPSAADEEATFDSDNSVSSDEEFEVASNEVAWNCRVCNTFNLQEKVAIQKSLKSRREGTKENAANIHIVVRTVGSVHERNVVEFKHNKRANHCRKCHTDSDYKPSRCNKERFFPVNDYKDQLHDANPHLHALEEAGASEEEIEAANRARAAEEKAAAEASAVENGVEGGGRGGKKDKFAVIASKGMAAGLRSPELSLREKLRLVRWKAKDLFQAFLDSEDKTNRVLYNDHTFKAELRKFMPFVSRRSLKRGEKYKIGDRVESIERRTLWYPGVVKRSLQNGCYDVAYDNGDLVETVLPCKIRYLPTYALSRLARFTLLNLLFICIVTPLPVASLYSTCLYDEQESSCLANCDAAGRLAPADEGYLTYEGVTACRTVERCPAVRCTREPTFSHPTPDEAYSDVMAPVVAFAFLGAIAVLCSSCDNFAKTAKAGARAHVRLCLYHLLPYAGALVFFHIVNTKMGGGGFMWYHASLAILFTSACVSAQFRQINHLYGTFCWALTSPLTCFSFLYALNLDEVLLSDAWIIYSPLIAFSAMLVGMRAVVPYVRGADF